MFNLKLTSDRRGFLGRAAAGAAAFGLSGLAAPLGLAAERATGADPAFEAWLNRITGKHKFLLDTPLPNDGFGLVWARVWLNSMNDTYGTTDADNSAVVVLRHQAIPFAMKSEMWAKYGFGANVKMDDPATHQPTTHNPFLAMAPGAFPIPGVGVDELLAKGVLVGVCNLALTFASMQAAKKMNLEPAAVKAEWVANLVPGVQIVPSGVLAVARAQEKGCGYCFAG